MPSTGVRAVPASSILPPNPAWEAQIRRSVAERWPEDLHHYSAVAIAQGRQESNWQPQAESHAGAKGLFQLMKPTAAEQAARLGLSLGAILVDPSANIIAGVDYLGRMLRRFRKSKTPEDQVAFGLAGYNCGPGCTSKRMEEGEAWREAESRFPGETRQYVRRIARFSAQLEPEGHGAQFRQGLMLP